MLGLATLYNEVFVVREGSSEIEVYDSATLTLQRSITVEGLNMASSVKYSCLYIADWGAVTGRNGGYVHRVKLFGKTIKWSLGDTLRGVSVTPDGFNVIVTFQVSRKIKEYTTHGELVRETRLQEDIVNPFIAIQLSTGQFVVSHGGIYGGTTDPLNRVCIVDIDGHIKECFGGPPWI